MNERFPIPRFLVPVMAGVLLAWSMAGLARGPAVSEATWIVELADRPSLEFEGGPAQGVLAAGDKPVRPMAATAPRITGKARFDASHPAVRRYADFLDGRRDAVLVAAAGRLGRALKPTHVYRHGMNGFAVRMSREEAEIVAALPGVRSVQPEEIHYLHTDAGPQWIGADLLWSGATGAPNPNRGEGMVLGVIDTGINWESPFFSDLPLSGGPISNPRGEFLGLCGDPKVPCNGKLIGVYDFTEEDTKGRDPDDHGSHVASIAVGNPLSLNLNFGAGGSIPFSTSGVAPRASLISYKACRAPEEGDGGFTCPGAALRAALEQAIVDQVDVVNYSIGTIGITPPSPWAGFGPGQSSVSRIFLNLRSAGIVGVSSAGNAGPGAASVSSPANSPWVLAVANATHDRRLTNRLVGTSGGPFALGELVGVGFSDGTTTRPIVHARDFGSALCGTGPAELGPECGNNTGASNPFPPGTFNGEIVVCDRGTYGRVEKGRNLELAGAGGYILANTADSTSELGDIITADRHCLPGTHVNQADGDRLSEWLESGAGHAGRLTGLERLVREEFGGGLAFSSARGPAGGAPDVMKPNLTAPGSSILGSNSQTTEDEIFVSLFSGTSMASPHVAGAALLLRKSHPDWGPDEVISGLETTASAAAVHLGDGAPARIVDRGAGGVRADQAARIGLFLPTTETAFVNANPALGGNPGSLNLPGIVSDNCPEVCSFTRRLRALAAGTWTVSTEGDLEIDVTPSQFTLGAGREREIEVTLGAGTVPLGTWGAGSIVLTPSSGDFAVQRLPVGAFISAGSVPEVVDITAQTNRGRFDLQLNNLGALPEAMFRTSRLVKPEFREPMLAQDPFRDNPFSGGPGTFSTTVEVPPGALALYAETFESSSLDIDLFVGRNFDGSATPSPSGLVCQSLSPDDLERCIIEDPQPGTWWVLVQNWKASGPNVLDNVPFEVAVMTEDADPGFVASGPGFHPGGPLTLPVYWDQPAMTRNSRWLAALAVSTTPDLVSNVGTSIIRLTRTGVNTPAATAIFAGETRPLVIPPNTTHDLLYIDVPPGTGGVEIEVAAPSGVSGRLARLDFDALAGVEPSTPTAPAGSVGETFSFDDGFRLSLVDRGSPPGSIVAGRYFAVLENSTGSEVQVEVSGRLIQVRQEIAPRRGLWSALGRSVGQGIEWQRVGADGFMLWYTYNEDRTPAFFISDAAVVDPETGSWTAPLFRVTGNGIRQSTDVVGRISLTPLEEDRMIHSWRINGRHGSERLDPVTVDACALLNGQPASLLGTWTIEGAREGGASVAANDIVEAWIRYYFDQTGVGRWVQYANGIENGDVLSLEVLDFRGFCPYCPDDGFDFEVVGMIDRQFFSQTQGREVVEFVSRPPLNTEYIRDREIRRLSEPGNCE